MVKLNVSSEDNEDRKPPDIFRAARNDDPIELAAALQCGQTLDDVESDIIRMTPMHVACVSRSRNFLRVACQMEFDPWIRDANQRLVIDHARAQGLKDVQKAAFAKMYPPGWADDAQVTPFPAPEGN
jgi:hypothetical protein